jgi:ring-1,2-phenylacetyl-CoA epoxidase subunit PaaB
VTDSQLPRYYVFKQDAVDDPLLNCGSIHAPDPELALMTARDVFVRRPACVSLWVVPARALLGRTAEEWTEAQPEPGWAEVTSPEPFAVFVKWDHRGQHAYCGQLQADSAEQALARAWQQNQSRSPVAVWVAPMGAVVRSQDDDADSWFLPAKDKPYRHGSYYHTHSLMREIKASPPAPDGDQDGG